MKRLLQNVKDFLSHCFPLHLNSTVLALEEELADVQWALVCHKALATTHRSTIDSLKATNEAFRRDNTMLRSVLHAAEREIAHQRGQLNELYASMTPKLSSWPVKATARLEQDSYYRDWYIRINVPSLSYALCINQGLRSGNHPEWVKRVSREIADQYRHTVEAEVSDLLTHAIKKA